MVICRHFLSASMLMCNCEHAFKYSYESTTQNGMYVPRMMELTVVTHDNPERYIDGKELSLYSATCVARAS